MASTKEIVEEVEYWSGVSLFINQALLTLAHCSKGEFVLKDSHYSYDEQGEVVAVEMPEDIHFASMIMAQNMFRFANN